LSIITDAEDHASAIQAAVTERLPLRRGDSVPAAREAIRRADRQRDHGRLYAWGNKLWPKGRFAASIYPENFRISGGETGEDEFARFTPVAQRSPNAYGVCDVGGHLWEWKSDCRENMLDNVVCTTECHRLQG
jgi:formylglycine-generating enzyme required for sulfatase activity